MSSLAPIALFAYNRLQHLRLTLEALQKNELAAQSDLFVFADGPRTTTDAAAVNEVRRFLKSVSGFGRVEIVESEHNKGLAASVLEGVTGVVSRRGRVIVLEDDLVTAPYFLRYMNDALDIYANDPDVASIHGYLYPVRERLPETFFLRGADCWGWATWKRAWDRLERDGKALDRELRAKHLEEAFDLFGAYPYGAMLRDQIAGKNQSWAILWHASAFVHGMYTLYPGTSLVRNIGADSTGTHLGRSTAFDVELASRPLTVARVPIEAHTAAAAAVAGFLRSIRPGILKRITSRIRTLLSPAQ